MIIQCQAVSIALFRTKVVCSFSIAVTQSLRAHLAHGFRAFSTWSTVFTVARPAEFWGLYLGHHVCKAAGAASQMVISCLEVKAFLL